MGLRRTILGKDYVLAIDVFAGTNWDLIVCLLSNGLERTSNEIEAGSKCGPATIPGTLTAKVPFEFQDVLDAANDEISEEVLHPLWQNKTYISWKFGKITPAAGDVTYTGFGYITQLNTTSPNDGLVSTTATLAVSGNMVQTRTGS